MSQTVQSTGDTLKVKNGDIEETDTGSLSRILCVTTQESTKYFGHTCEGLTSQS